MIQNFLHTGLRVALLACALPAIAQDGAAPTQRIEVSATRYDVRTVCPTIDAELPAKLARMAAMLQPTALVEVQFQIDGRRIVDVTTRGGSFDTRTATRRAVRSLDCDNGHAGRQTVRFDVNFRLDDDTLPPGDTGALAAFVPQAGPARPAE